MLSIFLIQLLAALTHQTVQLKEQRTCRAPGESLEPKKFASYACGLCFYFTFFTSKRYEMNYIVMKCSDGTLICDRRELRAMHNKLSNNEKNNLSASNAEISQRNSPSAVLDPEIALFHDNCNCETTKNRIFNLNDYGNDTRPLENLVMEPSLPYNYVQMTRDCCQAADACCKLMQDDQKDSIAHCPQTWDGWQCWPAAKSGTMSKGICPYYVYDVTTMKTTPNPSEYYSEKNCTSNGQWWKSKRSNVEWTDYRKCATARLHAESVKHFVGIGAFALSVISIIPAVIIFSMYRSLRVDRITIHKHLLISFLLNGIFYIFNNIFFVADAAHGASFLEENHISCRLAFLVQLSYLRTSNYMWMLCEGLYLYKLLIDAFSESRSLKLYYLLGWAFPVVPTLIYALLRQKLDNEKCWIVSNVQWIQWVTHGPSIASLALNLFLMISIIRILITKLRHTSSNEPAQYRKAVRATLVLLPVFGLHFFLTIYKMEHVLWYEVINKLLDGFQGLFVATIICYTHSEVIELLRKSWLDWQDRRMCNDERRKRTKKLSFADQSAHALL